MVADGDISTVRFTIEIDPEDVAKQDAAIVDSVAALFPVAKYSAGTVSVHIIDVQAGSGGGTTRKIQCIAIGHRIAT